MKKQNITDIKARIQAAKIRMKKVLASKKHSIKSLLKIFNL